MKASPEDIARFERMAMEMGGTVNGTKASNDAPKVSEKAFQQAIIDEAKRNGWRVFHPYDSRKSTAGWPDLVCLRNGVMIIAELKVPPNKTTAAQEAWLEDFRILANQCEHVEVFLWRPADWPTILETLRRLV